MRISRQIKGLLSHCCLAMIVLASALSVQAQGTTEKVTVTTPGTLMELVTELESSRIFSLTIEGTLNTEDLSFIGSNAGRLSQVKELNLSAISLVAGDEPYKTYSLKENPSSLMGSNTAYFCISDTARIETVITDAPLGGLNYRHYVYGKDLAGLFAGTSYQKIILPEGQKTVGFGCFYEMENLTDVVFSSSIEEIGDYAFARSKGLTALDLPANVVKIGECAFYRSNLESLNMTGNLRSIGKGAFQEAELQSIDLSQVEEVGEKAFYSCPVTGDLNLSKLSVIEDEAFYFSTSIYDENSTKNIILSPGLKSIGNSAFKAAIKTLDLPEGLVSIGDYAFDNCFYLKDISFPSSLRSIGYHAFERTEWNRNLSGDNGVVYIGNIAYAFDSKSLADKELLNFRDDTYAICANFSLDDDDVKKVIFPSSLRRIENGSNPHCLFGSRSLEEVVLNEGIEYIADRVFSGCNKMWIEKWPESLTYIGKYAFSGCNGLSEITLSKNLEFIGYNAFESCKGLYSIKYNCNKVKYIDYYYEGAVFYGCDGLYSITIGSDVNSILPTMFSGSGVHKVLFDNPDARTEKLTLGSECFSGCSNLTEITLPATYSIGDGCFYNSGLKKLIVDGDCDYFESCYWYLGRNIESVSVTGRIRKVGDKVFYGDHRGSVLHTFEALSCDSIGNYAFRDSNIQNFVIQEGSTVYGEEAFCNCKSLESISINDNSVLGEDMFKYSSLQEVNLGKGIVCIPANAFYGCGSLRGFYPQSKIETIGAWAFCKTVIPSFDFEAIKSIGEGAFGSVDFTDMPQLYLPDGFSDLGESAFASTNFSSVSLPISLLTIPTTAFKDAGRFNLEWRIPEDYKYEGTSYNVIYNAAFASALTNTEVIVPEGVHEIKNIAFYNDNIKTISLPSTLQVLFANALQKGEGGTVETIYCHAATPPSVDTYGLLSNWLDDIFDCVIYVPASSLERYKEDDFWSRYNVQPMPVEVEEIVLDETSITLAPGESYMLNVEIKPYDATETSLTWASSDSNVATVSSSGLVVAVGEGSAVVTVSAPNGVAASCQVFVEAKVIEMEAILLDAADLVLEEGQSYQLTATVVPYDVTYTELEWWSDDENVAVVDGSGLVTITGTGETIIHVRSAVWNYVEAECRVNGVAGVDGIISDDLPCDIYSISGELLRKGVSSREIERIAKGTYIVVQGTKRIKFIK